MINCYYVTYRLGGVKLFNNGTQIIHVGLYLKDNDNNSYCEFHYTSSGKVKECGYKDYRKGHHLATYEMGQAGVSLGEARDLILSRFNNTHYKLGQRDCFSMVEWFADDIVGVDKAKLKGPVGQRAGIANGVRHNAKVVGQVAEAIHKECSIM